MGPLANQGDYASAGFALSFILWLDGFLQTKLGATAGANIFASIERAHTRRVYGDVYVISMLLTSSLRSWSANDSEPAGPNMRRLPFPSSGLKLKYPTRR